MSFNLEWAKIKNFDYVPTKAEVNKAKEMWFDWVSYVDDIVKNTEWRKELVWLEKDVKSYMLFDDSKIDYAPTAKSLDKIDDALLAEARKYKSADDWIKKFRDETYNVDHIDTKISDKAKEFNRKYVPLLEDWTTKKYKENIQSIIEDITVDTDSMLKKIEPIKEKLYNYQKSKLRKIREEANKAK